MGAKPKTDAGEHSHVTCTACGEEVRDDRVNSKGVCVNCLALGKKDAAAGDTEPATEPD